MRGCRAWTLAWGVALAASSACGGGEVDDVPDRTHLGSGGAGGAPGGTIEGCSTGSAPRDSSRVRVTVYQRRAPAACAVVWFGDPTDGKPIVTGTTDPDGAFSAAVPDGASVTAAVLVEGSDPPSWRLFSVLRTSPGDDIELGERPRMDLAEDGGKLEVTLPGTWAGARRYGAGIGCVESTAPEPSSPLESDVDPTCLGAGPTVAVVAHAFDEAGTELAFALALDVATPALGATTPVTVGPWRTDFASFTTKIVGLPPTAGATQTQLTAVRGRVRFDEGTVTKPAPPGGGSVTHALAYEPGLPERLAWRANVALGPSMDRDGALFFVRSTASDPLPDGDVIDLATDALPAISSPGAQIGANGSPSLSWTSAGDGSQADGIVAVTQTTYADGTSVRWTMVAPADATTIAFPTVPDAIAGVRAAPSESPRATIYLIEAEHIAGWDDFRGGAAQALFDDTAPTMDLRVRVSMIGQLGL